MLNRYITKRDMNGNTYRLEIDHDARTFRENCGLFTKADAVTVTRRELRSLKESAKNSGYKCADV